MNTETKTQIMKSVLTVKEKQYITPHYIRIILEGDDLSVYKNANVGDNNKIVIPLDKNKPLELPEGKPNASSDYAVRTYTMRALDIEKGEMAVDFVMHGETGPASTWAIQAKNGDELGVLMKEKSKPLFVVSDYYFFIGDHTALPIISVMLEELPANAKGDVILEVFDEEDVIDLIKPEGITIKWLFNATPGIASELSSEFDKLNIASVNNKFVFTAAEYHSVQEIQQKLRAITNLDRKHWYAYSYWKNGVAEDASQHTRRALQQN